MKTQKGLNYAKCVEIAWNSLTMVWISEVFHEFHMWLLFELAHLMPFVGFLIKETHAKKFFQFLITLFW